MTASSPMRIILAAEGPSDLRRIGVLVDHFVTARLPEEARSDDRQRFEPVDGEPYVPHKAIPALARACGFDRRYTRGDADNLRKLCQVLKKKLLDPGTVIIWARDDDGVPERRSQAVEARSALPPEPPIVLAIASECGEAWVIAGWTAVLNDPKKLKDLRQRLGFHAHEHPENLSHKEHAPKSAKAVLAEIFAGDVDKEAEALIAAAGSNSPASRACGLADFCAEIQACLSPTQVGPSAPS